MKQIRCFAIKTISMFFNGIGAGIGILLMAFFIMFVLIVKQLEKIRKLAERIVNFIIDRLVEGAFMPLDIIFKHKPKHYCRSSDPRKQVDKR